MNIASVFANLYRSKRYSHLGENPNVFKDWKKKPP